MKNALSNPGSFVAGRMLSCRHAAVVSLLLGLVSPSAQAVTGSWNVDAAGTWSTTANWLGSVVPGSNSSGDVVNFTYDLTAARTVTVDGINKFVSVLNIGDANNTAAYTIYGGVSLLFTNGVNSSQINQIATSKGDTITTPIYLYGNSPLTISNASANTLTIGSWTTASAGTRTLVVDGANAVNYTGYIGSANLAVVKSGAGALTVAAGSNDFGGGLTLNAGTLNLNSNVALGAATGVFTINGGAINTNAARTLSNNNPQAWNGDFAFSGTAALNLGTGPVTMNASRSVAVNASALTVGGVIGGTGFGLTKNGAGSLVFNGANTYTGATTVNAGILSVATLANGGVNSGVGASSNAAASLILNGGTLL